MRESKVLHLEMEKVDENCEDELRCSSWTERGCVFEKTPQSRLSNREGTAGRIPAMLAATEERLLSR